MIFKEIAGSIYAWDIADEGTETILDNLQEKSLVNSVYLVALMHHEKRPLTDFYYPHNPVRKVYFPEDSRAYWKPNMDYYKDSRIKPLTSGRDFLKGKDWLEILIKAGRKRGFRTGVEVSHTILDKERAKGEFPDCIQQDIYGNRFGQRVCPNNSDVRNYILSLFRDLVANYDVDMIQTCLVLFERGRFPLHHLPDRGPLAQLLGMSLGGCFCKSCEEKAKNKGLDWEAIKRIVKRLADALTMANPEGFHEANLFVGGNLTNEGLLLEQPEYYQWLKFRCDSITELMANISAAIKRIKPSIDFRYNTFIPNPEVSGLDLRSASKHMDSIRDSDYTEQQGDESKMALKKARLLNLRRAIGDEKKFIAAIGIRPKATPELIRQGVIIAAYAGADGLSLGHYDGAPFKNLEAIKEGMAEAEVTVASE